MVLGRIARSAVTVGPLDAVFAGLDYMDGRQQGESFQRAAGGAIGSAAGGLGGAMAGAAAGGAIGSVVPVIGTGIGAAVGGIVGGMGGSFAGGWGSDRLLDTVAGKREKNSLPIQVKNSLGVYAGGAAAAGAGILGYNKLREMSKGGNNMTGPMVAYETGRLAGLDPWEAAGAAGRGQAQAAGAAARNAGRRMPWKTLGGAGAAIGAGVVANNMLGNPVGRGVNYALGGEGNADARYDNADPTIKARLDEARALNGFANSREYMDYMEQQGRENQELAFKRNWQRDDYFNRMDYSAQQAKDLLDSYSSGMERAGRDAATILGARF